MSEQITTPEALDIKKYTQYRCTTPGCGKSSMWTGALAARRSPRDGYCRSCGVAMTEEVDDGQRWRVSFELIGPFSSDWHPTSRETSSEHDARTQVAGLRAQAAQGEPIRNVRLEVAETAWREVTP